MTFRGVWEKSSLVIAGVDVGVGGVCVLLFEPFRRLRLVIAIPASPLRRDVFDGVLDEGNDDNDVCLSSPTLELFVAPFVDDLCVVLVAILWEKA